MYRQLLM